MVNLDSNISLPCHVSGRPFAIPASLLVIRVADTQLYELLV
ncbi:hypothetical protein [Wolbachia endosymbiont of Folsomia candida]|nr:hypothetical protein [Wolbachia endosymbiont of Folsomia candida]